MENLIDSLESLKAIIELLDADAQERGKYGETSLQTLKRIISQRDQFEKQWDDLPDGCPNEKACQDSFLEEYNPPERDEP